MDGDTVTTAFRDDHTEPEGPFDESIIARGFVGANTVQPRNASGISNRLQAEPVNNDGNSVNPDVVNVERNVPNNSSVFTFDEAVNVSDISGFNLFTSDGTESSNVVAATNRAPTVVEVEFGESTPVEEAVGGSVESNAVIGQDGPGSDTNLPDEELLTSSSATSSIGGLAFTGFGFAGLAAASVLLIRRRWG